MKTVDPKIAFMQWLKRAHPKIYHQAIARADGNTGLSGLGEENDNGQTWWQKALGAVTAVGGAYLTLKNQRDQLALNIERAKQNLPPVDVAGQPVITTQVDVSPDVVEKIAASASQNVNKILMFGGLALAGVLLLNK